MENPWGDLFDGIGKGVTNIFVLAVTLLGLIWIGCCVVLSFGIQL